MYYILVLRNKPFDFIVLSSFLFHLHLIKYINNSVIYPEKSTVTKFKADFSCTFTTFWTWMSQSNLG